MLYNIFQVIFMIVGNTKHNCRPLTLFMQNRDRALSGVSPPATNNIYLRPSSNIYVN